MPYWDRPEALGVPWPTVALWRWAQRQDRTYVFPPQSAHRRSSGSLTAHGGLEPSWCGRCLDTAVLRVTL
jgi:hypothetical protein